MLNLTFAKINYALRGVRRTIHTCARGEAGAERRTAAKADAASSSSRHLRRQAGWRAASSNAILKAFPAPFAGESGIARPRRARVIRGRDAVAPRRMPHPPRLSRFALARILHSAEARPVDWRRAPVQCPACAVRAGYPRAGTLDPNRAADTTGRILKYPRSTKFSPKSPSIHERREGEAYPRARMSVFRAR